MDYPAMAEGSSGYALTQQIEKRLWSFHVGGKAVMALTASLAPDSHRRLVRD